MRCRAMLGAVLVAMLCVSVPSAMATAADDSIFRLGTTNNYD